MHPGQRILRKIGGGLIRLSESRSNGLDLTGDRDIEWSWMVSRMGGGPGTALDFGNGGSMLGLVAARCGYQVTAIDQMAIDWPYQMPNLTFVQGDFLTMTLPLAQYDLILNCSTVEHVGLAGRYGSAAYADGDLQAMRKLLDLAQPDGKMLLTIPVGRDAVFAPLHRIYGEERLPRLLEGWRIDEEEYWLKQADGRWTRVERPKGLSYRPQPRLYGLGLFVLSPEVP